VRRRSEENVELLAQALGACQRIDMPGHRNIFKRDAKRLEERYCRLGRAASRGAGDNGAKLDGARKVEMPLVGGDDEVAGLDARLIQRVDGNECAALDGFGIDLAAVRPVGAHYVDVCPRTQPRTMQHRLARGRRAADDVGACGCIGQIGCRARGKSLIGEAPGEQEDRRGEPFVGPAGQLLDKMIEAMGWTRETVYIANTTKCRPPGNRNPQPDELEQCMPFLHAQIAAIAPRIIVALGRPASNQLLGTDAPISALRGRFHDYVRLTSERYTCKVMPTFHPAYLLRDPDKKRIAWADLKLVMAELVRLGISAPNHP